MSVLNRRDLLPLMIALACLGAACRDRAREEAAQRARDQGTLAQLVAMDQRLDRALKEADDASRAGEDAKAASILETSAVPAAEAAIAETSAKLPETPSAQERQRELLAVLKDRRAEIPRYVEALRGTDLDAKLAAVEAQLALQKRAMQAATTALSWPGDAGEAPLHH
jgi:hypothetical protein